MTKLSHALDDAPVVTFLLLALALVVVIAGAVVTIIRPASLSFHDYVLDVTILVSALGLGAGIGRGAIAAAKVQHPEGESPPEVHE
jgi:hypothetical protein